MKKKKSTILQNKSYCYNCKSLIIFLNHIILPHAPEKKLILYVCFKFLNT